MPIWVGAVFALGWFLIGVGLGRLLVPRVPDRQLYLAQQRALIRGRADKFKGYDGWGDVVDSEAWPE